MKAGVVVFPGSNCDRDAARALACLTGQPPAMIWHEAREVPALDLVLLPGGFSYGDYLRPGCMAAHSPVMAAVRSHAGRGGAVLGICNGFQILTEAGLLPGALIANGGISFVCREVDLVVARACAPFTSCYEEGAQARIPVAHHGGNYQADDEVFARLEGEGRIVFRYAAQGNPNGSRGGVAGIVSAQGNVLGLMPHPERAWEGEPGGKDGLPLFRSLLEAFG